MLSARLCRCFIVVTRSGNVPGVYGGGQKKPGLCFKSAFNNLSNLSKYFDTNPFSKQVF